MYKVKKSDLKGQIKDFPIEVVQKMVEKQVHQGHKADVGVFRVKTDDSWNGFLWTRTIEGDSFWRNVIYQADFPLFFEKYPKKEEKKEHKGVNILNEFAKAFNGNDAKKNIDELEEIISDCLEHPENYGIDTKENDIPPLEVLSKFDWDKKRIDMLKEGIKRYLDADKPIPVDWIAEYNELVKGNE